MTVLVTVMHIDTSMEISLSAFLSLVGTAYGLLVARLSCVGIGLSVYLSHQSLAMLRLPLSRPVLWSAA